MRKVFGFARQIELKEKSEGAASVASLRILFPASLFSFPADFWNFLLLFLLSWRKCLYATPAQLQIIVQAPWRYGSSTSEKENSFAHCLINAFPPHAAFDCAGRLIRVGDPVAGFVEPTSGDSKSAHLIAWDVCEPDVWKMCAPASVPSYFELNPNAMFRLPQLAAESFVYVRFPKTNFAFLAAPTPVFGQFAPREPDAPPAVARGRSAVRSPSRRKKRPRTPSSGAVEAPRSSNWSARTPSAILVEGLFELSSPFLFLATPARTSLKRSSAKLLNTASFWRKRSLPRVPGVRLTWPGRNAGRRKSKSVVFDFCQLLAPQLIMPHPLTLMVNSFYIVLLFYPQLKRGTSQHFL